MRAVLVCAAVFSLAAFAEGPPRPATAIPYSFDRAVTQADLEGKSLRELNLMRNTIYARAGNVFRKAWLRDYFTQQSWYRPTGLDESKLSELDKKNAAAIGEYEAGLSREELRKRTKAIENDQTPEGKIERRLLGRALGIGGGIGSPPGESQGGGGDSSPLDNPAMLDHVLAVSSLDDYSARDLRFLRNLIYARRGRPFKTPLLRHYFERMSGYRADPKYTDARLTDTDLRNIKIIQTVEARVAAQKEGAGAEIFGQA